MSTSVELKGTWYRFGAAIEITPEEGDDFGEVKKKAWNTVESEIEKQVKEVLS